MSITADLAHQLIRDLKLTSDYYNKIFRCISGLPKWLTRNLRQAFEQIETTDRNTFLQYNPDWEIPKTPVPTKQCCNHPPLSGSSTLCTCSCCHYRCPTHSTEYYGFSYWTCLFMTEIALFTMFAAEIITSIIALIVIIITHQERAHLEREIAQAEERNTRLREEVQWLREQHTVWVITKKPVIVIVQNQSPEVKEEEVTPEILKANPIPEQCEHWTTPGGFSERSAVIAASLSKKLKKHGFGNLKINMHHTCAKNNPYSVLTCHTCRLPKTPSNSSFVPPNPNNTIPAKPKTTSERTKTKKKLQEKTKENQKPSGDEAQPTKEICRCEDS